MLMVVFGCWADLLLMVLPSFTVISAASPYSAPSSEACFAATSILKCSCGEVGIVKLVLFGIVLLFTSFWFVW